MKEDEELFKVKFTTVYPFCGHWPHIPANKRMTNLYHMIHASKTKDVFFDSRSLTWPVLRAHQLLIAARLPNWNDSSIIPGFRSQSAIYRVEEGKEEFILNLKRARQVVRKPNSLLRQGRITAEIAPATRHPISIQ